MVDSLWSKDWLKDMVDKGRIVDHHLIEPGRNSWVPSSESMSELSERFPFADFPLLFWVWKSFYSNVFVSFAI
jgi:hypothetical protein